jgi:hypothetical protein
MVFIFFLYYNLLALKSGPTFLISDTILYTLVSGASIIRVMTIRKDDIKDIVQPKKRGFRGVPFEPFRLPTLSLMFFFEHLKG